MIKLGLIGFPLGHSFSKSYYLKKFKEENITNIAYDLYEIEDINLFKDLYVNNPDLRGCNVTIPHKVAILPFLDELSDEVKAIGATNCITISHTEGELAPKLRGYNTDIYGFQASLTPLLKAHHKRALVLGTGGASKAILYVLKQLEIPYLIVSRTKEKGDLTYEELTPRIIQENTVIINCTPLGTFPNTAQYPQLPYDALTADHLLYDLIYNPEETLFLKNGKERGAHIKNGYEMLILQAEKNWEIWHNSFKE